MIKLINNSIADKDLSDICKFIMSKKHLTKHKKTLEFEEQFRLFVDKIHAIYVNSGSSANLLMANIVKEMRPTVKNKIVIPALCWSTSISPFIQLGYDIKICDIELDTLGIDFDCYKKICNDTHALLFVNILGFANKNMKQILDFINHGTDRCNKTVLEDNCESFGSDYDNKMLGTIGDMGSYSFFWSHQLNTLEGGMLVTNSAWYCDYALMMRSHGWVRDLNSETKKTLIGDVDSFHMDFTFHTTGFNIRNTDIGAFIGLQQLREVRQSIQKRHDLFEVYQNDIKNTYWKIKPAAEQKTISAFAYPIIHPNRQKIIEALKENNIECRPLIAGNITKHPFYTRLIKDDNKYPNADIVNDYGLYVPLHPELTKESVQGISKVINGAI